MKNDHICSVAVAPLRKEPSDKSEIVSQLLFGDAVTVIEKTDKWFLVQNSYDGYQGWLDFKQLTELTPTQCDTYNTCNYLAPAQLNNTLVGPNQSNYYLSPGSTLPFYQNGFCYLGQQKFEVKFTPTLPDRANFKDNIEKTAFFFENSPYLWGGRTLFGIDCSGFVQAVYKLMGIVLKRDAWEQAETGELVDFLAAANLGDLAFFDNEEGKITHVGLMLSNDKIIHAAGKVRIDAIDNQGIYNTDLGKYTHKLRIIKRFV